MTRSNSTPIYKNTSLDDSPQSQRCVNRKPPPKDESNSPGSEPVQLPQDTPGLELDALVLQLLLYTLQGIPMGLSASVPLLLVSNPNVSVSMLGLFSAVSMPFSLKIFWAPVVDCLHIELWGRRKCWLMPIQCFCGLLMMIMGFPSAWLGDSEDPRALIDQWMTPMGIEAVPDIVNLSRFFFVIYFLMATQDIAVDGWAISMLSPINRGMASTMNTIGQSLGVVIGNALFLSMANENTMMMVFGTARTVTLGSFTGYCGLAFILVSLVLPFKTEVESEDDEDDEYGSFGTTTTSKITNAYRCVWRLANLPAVFKLGLVLICTKLPFAGVDKLTQLELVKAGLTKDTMALVSPFSMPLGFIFPVLITKLSIASKTNEKLMHWAKAYQYRLTTIPLAVMLLMFMRFWFREGTGPMASGDQGQLIPLCAYVIYVIISELLSTFMFLTQMAIFNEVSDPRIGGINMTFLNTIANMGTLSAGMLVYPLLEHMPMADRIDPFITLSATTFVLGLLSRSWVHSNMLSLSQYKNDDWKIDMNFNTSKNKA